MLCYVIEKYKRVLLIFSNLADNRYVDKMAGTYQRLATSPYYNRAVTQFKASEPALGNCVPVKTGLTSTRRTLGLQ